MRITEWIAVGATRRRVTLLTFFLTIGFGSFAEAQVDPLRSGYIIGRIEIAPGVPLEDCEVRMETFRGGDRYPSARSRCDEDGLFKIDYSPPGAAQPDPQAPSVAEQTPVVPAPVVPDERPPLLRTDEPLLELGVEVDVNRPGSDYRSFEMRQADAKLCQQACAEDQQCRAWTYVKPGVQGNTARCWLKNAVPNPQPDDCCTSGAKGL